MSGPKRADVEAALNTAARSAHEAASMIAKSDRAAVDSMQSKLAVLLREADELRRNLRDVDSRLGSAPHGREETAAARRAVAEAAAALDGGRDRAAELAESSRAADSAEETARRAHSAAQVEYDKAEQGLRRAGDHYLRSQMEWAVAARKLFDEAGQQAKRAAALRSASKRLAGESLEHAQRSVARARHALAQARAAEQAAEARARAAAEAARIAAEKERIATAAVADARISVESLDPAVVDKFVPDARPELAEIVSRASSALAAGRPDDALRLVEGVAARATGVSADAAHAKQEWDQAKARALGAQQELDSLLEAVDTDLVAGWADDGSAAAEARRTADALGGMIAGEDFEVAAADAARARDALASATASAAAAKGQDLRRREVGEAIMDALEDLGFDISYEDGTRDEPLRISGQVADATGRGDFDIEIPLDGEVDFEVTAEAGDVSCVNAIRSLQERLAERGIAWSVTDWGHAEGAVDGTSRVKTQERSQTRTRSTG
ncbi:hypothetical protein [Microbacterium lacticum]